MRTLFLNSVIGIVAATLLIGCDATTTTQNGSTNKSAAAPTGALQTGTHMR